MTYLQNYLQSTIIFSIEENGGYDISGELLRPFWIDGAYLA